MRLLKAMQEAERFSPTEQSVIDYITKNPQEIAIHSIKIVKKRKMKTGKKWIGVFRDFLSKNY